MINPTTAAEAVAQGAQLLDEKKPGWWRLISEEVLDLTSCEACVCGQLALASYDEVARRVILSEGNMYWSKFTAYYWHFLKNELGLDDDKQHGFSVPWTDDEEEYLFTWEELEAEWRTVIRARLEADKLPPAEQEELTSQELVSV